jgi:hypothetical protein
MFGSSACNAFRFLGVLHQLVYHCNVIGYGGSQV